MINKINYWIVVLAFSVPAITLAQSSYSPPVEQDYPLNVYWGDTHVHTKLSTDAYGAENRLDASSAYRFARGEEVTTSHGKRTKLRRALDFLVVADHSENLGVWAALNVANPMLLNTAKGKALYDRLMVTRDEAGDKNLFPAEFWELFSKDRFVGADYKRSVWEQVIENAEKFNDPGKFTAFIGYEWTVSPLKPKGAHLHRVVIFKEGADKAEEVIPSSQIDSNKPEDLWSYLSDYEEKTNGEILAIPHNGNLSQGKLFALDKSNGQPLDADYAKNRARWEPLLEVTQVKGDSETHPTLSPSDEFADYETWNGAKYSEFYGAAGNWMRPYEYARSGLKLGLQQQATLGINPFKFGMIGSTDSHTSLATADNDNFWGKNVVNGPAYPNRMLDPRYLEASAENIELDVFETLNREQ